MTIPETSPKPEYQIVNGWICEVHNECSCAGGTIESSYMHEHFCGLEPLGEISKATIKRTWSYMYGAPGWYWRVEHETLPSYFNQALHLYTFEDAIEYANDVVCRAVRA